MRGAITALRIEVARAECLRRKVGAVVMKDGVILGTGHNRLPDLEGSCLDGQCPRGLLSYDDQPKDVGYEESGCKAIHAEAAALAEAGAQAVGATLYVTDMPCPGCQAAIEMCGITRVQVLNLNHPTFTQKFLPPV